MLVPLDGFLVLSSATYGCLKRLDSYRAGLGRSCCMNSEIEAKGTDSYAFFEEEKTRICLNFEKKKTLFSQFETIHRLYRYHGVVA